MPSILTLTPQAAARQLHNMTGIHPTEWLRIDSPERLDRLADLLLDIAAVDEKRGRAVAQLYRIAQGELVGDRLLRTVLHQHRATDGPPDHVPVPTAA